jgi:hypothetical protein
MSFGLPRTPRQREAHELKTEKEANNMKRRNEEATKQ